MNHKLFWRLFLLMIFIIMITPGMLPLGKRKSYRVKGGADEVNFIVQCEDCGADFGTLNAFHRHNCEYMRSEASPSTTGNDQAEFTESSEPNTTAGPSTSRNDRDRSDTTTSNATAGPSTSRAHPPHRNTTTPSTDPARPSTSRNDRDRPDTTTSNTTTAGPSTSRAHPPHRNTTTPISTSEKKQCPKCSGWQLKRNHIRHLEKCARGDKRCPICHQEVDDMRVHIGSCGLVTYPCRCCSTTFTTGRSRSIHEKRCRTASHPSTSSSKRAKAYRADRSSINGLFRQHVIKPDITSPDFDAVLSDAVPRVVEVLEHQPFTAFKFYLTIDLKMAKLVENDVKVCNFQTGPTIITEGSDIEEEVGQHITALVIKVEEYVRNGSGWVVECVADIHIHVTRYNPIVGSSFIKLPSPIAKKRSLLNIQNNDDKCLLWCIIAALHPASANPHRVSHYKCYESDLRTSCAWPAQLKDLTRIEDENNLRLYVYGWDVDDGFYPLRITNRKEGFVVNMLLIGNENTQHYVLIKSLSGLLSERTKHEHSLNYCNRCLHGFKKQENLDKHVVDCEQFKVQRTEMPEKTHTKFEAYRKMVKVPLYVIADFESFISAGDKIHQPCGYAFKICSSLGYEEPIEIYRGENAAETFILRMHEVYSEVEEYLHSDFDISTLTADEERRHNMENCWICTLPFTADQQRVMDHDHFIDPSGGSNYLGPAHNDCNLARRSDTAGQKLRILFHNFRGYDCHLLIKDLCRHEDDLSKVQLIPRTIEKYTSVSSKHFIFLDSYQLLSMSLDSCVKNLVGDGLQSLKSLADYVDEKYGDDDDDGRERKLQLLSRKGVYPYSYMDSEEKFEEPMPPRAAFFNDLNQEPISEEDWQHVNRVWNEFELQDLGDLHDLYVATDVLLLADVVEKFREDCYSKFQLEALQYFTLPGLSWDACLKMTRAELQNIQDIDMYIFLEKGIRGGISVISHRYCKANHHLLADFNPAEDKKHIIYVDANNLYGWSMVQKLPYNNFRWLEESELKELQIEAFDSDGDYGCILEIDVEIPENIHDATSDYPLLPERLEINQNIISPFSSSVRDIRGRPSNFSSIKLAPNLLPKSKYITHMRNLQFYISMGVIVTKVHRAVKFNQKSWMKTYIDYNTRERQLATTESKKALHKLLNNACFGKTMESKRKHINVVLIDSERRQVFQTSKPGFKRFAIFSEELAAVEVTKPKVVLDKPIYAGFTILELSKLLMYEFYYKVMKVRYPNLKLLFTDTDSLTLEINTEDVYEDLKDAELAHHFDFSNYPTSHPLYNTANKSVLGKFKDECQGLPASEFIGLRSKMYSISIPGMGTKSTAAGVKKSVAKRELTHQLYKEVLLNRQDTVISQHLISSKDHIVKTIEQRRIGLTCYDDKRYILSDGISSLPYGHKDLE